MGTPKAHRRPLAPDTRRILVVRLNKRLGNILFLTPMLRSLAATLPEARIDVLIQSPAQAKLLQSLPGIGRIWIQENRLLATLRTLHALRAERYDLAIDPTGNSASNRIGVALIAARQRMGFAKTDQWLPLTHAAGKPKSRHQALQAVELLAGAIAEPPVETFDTLAVFPDENDRAAADRHWRATLGEHATTAPVIGFFSRATGRKALPRHWWQAWILEVRRAVPQAVLLEILPGADAEPVVPEIAHVAIEPLTELAALMSRLDQFVAADSGPMHLAAASGTPVIGLFRTTLPSDYAPLGQDCETVEGDALTPEDVAARLARRLSPRAEKNNKISGLRS
ncbi:glycosyltransferase family 9 protein [Salinisphaera sp.]|uniref:glycosyltransferase family 9 protein n=1 Tax=Salinisphaera sp. TaxID=1914330 RepID=UPI002D78EB88|nr:glycosyltransferase family 9 protein [Salinisphaera sp.]HET7313370.1 glycosyltransferase family 9 protein [Salinisphaera sp.]